MAKAFIFEGRNGTQRTEHEKIAMKNTRYAINYIVGGYYNCMLDGYEEDIPDTLESLKEEIYESAMQNKYGEGYEGYNKAPREMRFAGSKFVKEYIDWRIKNSSVRYDIEEIAEVKNWN